MLHANWYTTVKLQDYTALKQLAVTIPVLKCTVYTSSISMHEQKSSSTPDNQKPTERH